MSIDSGQSRTGKKVRNGVPAPRPKEIAPEKESSLEEKLEALAIARREYWERAIAHPYRR